MQTSPIPAIQAAPQATGMLQRMAAYVVASRGRPAAGPARESALRRVLDLLAGVAAGLHEPGAVAVRDVSQKLLAGGGVPVWFTGLSGSAAGAAWANSAAASVLDLDDGHRMARGHPGAAVIPTAFAVAAETDAGLEELLAAIVIGYEVGVGIGAARTAYGSTGTWSAYAVAATAAALRGTTQPVLEHALAIAGESAPNQLFSSMPPGSLPVPEGSDIKEGIPWSVVTGLAALDLAEAGFTGPRNVLDSRLHYDFRDPRPLGEAWHICTSYYKLYACCRHIHPPLDAFLGLVERHGIDVLSISQVVVETYSGALRITNKVLPTSLVDVQYSIPYCLALAALDGPQSLLPVAVEALNRPELSAFAAKVVLRLDAALDAEFPARTLARVVVVDATGQHFVSEVTAPRGEATNPLNWQELEAKFIAATRRAMDGMQQGRLLAALRVLRVSGDLAPLLAYLAAPVAARPSLN